MARKCEEFHTQIIGPAPGFANWIPRSRATCVIPSGATRRLCLTRAKPASHRAVEEPLCALVDILICAIALARHCSIFTTDPDFQNYSRILPIKLHSPASNPRAGGAE